jgi:hypothetical protein
MIQHLQVNKPDRLVAMIKYNLDLMIIVWLFQHVINVHNTIGFDQTSVSVMKLDFNVTTVGFVLTVDPEMVSLLDGGLLFDLNDRAGGKHLVGYLDVQCRVL